MKTRLAIGLIFLGLLIGCSGSGPTAPQNVNLTPPTPVATQLPLPDPTPTPSRPCGLRLDCGE